MNVSLDQKCVNTIRTLSMDAVQKANSGHPGTAMALAPVMHTLFDRYLDHSPSNPEFANRDRFVLSIGHASMLIYSTFHLTGYDLPLEDLKNFRQWGSKCAGHPEYGHCPGVETTTGPLGQGVATSVGMAIAEKWLASHFNRPGHNIIDYSIYALCGDGCMMEGISYEAASLAGHLKLDNLVWIYDNNRITIEGNTSLAFSEDVATRFMAANWNVLRVGDANDLERLDAALKTALNEDERPTMIIVDSHIAYGAPNKQDTSGAHGSPLGDDEIRLTKRNYGWPEDSQFLVPDDVAAHMGQAVERGRQSEAQWKQRFEIYREEHPDLAAQFETMKAGDLPSGWDSEVPVFPPDAKGVGGRAAGGKVENAIASKVPWLVGGSADLAPSTLTRIQEGGDFSAEDYSGRNLHFGVREHMMGACINGMALSKLRAFGSQFLIFSDYERAPIRLSALMHLPTINVFTHDSIGVGEDGPTHQPIEHLVSLRAVPQLLVIRPCDANEVAEAWKVAVQQKKHPVALILSRQNIPTYDRSEYASASGLCQGAYVFSDSDGSPDVILMASGSELQWIVEAQNRLADEGIQARVVAAPCLELFERQPRAYREQVLPPSIRSRVAIEAGTSLGWRRYVGLDGAIIARRHFGASAPLAKLLEEFGFTVENVVTTAKAVIEGHAPCGLGKD